MNILYITRKYPPSIGGMQRMSYFLSESLKNKANVDMITWGHTQAMLPVFLIKAVFKSLIYIFIRNKKYDFIFLGDAALSPFGVFLKNITGGSVICVAHGLDVTFNNHLYQKCVISALKKIDIVVCVSNNTKNECIIRGIELSRIRVIPDGVNLQTPVDKKSALAELKKNGITIPENFKILLTVGRLVKRKGVADFIEEVFADLLSNNSKVVYIVAGTGEERKRIIDIIEKNSLGDSVLMLGKISDKMLNLIYSISDIFVMPNIKVAGNVEGFGIVALEASGYGVPVIAYEIDGIRDAVKDGENGFLIPCKNIDIFSERISYLLEDDKARALLGEKACKFARKFSWDIISDRYLEAMDQAKVS